MASFTNPMFWSGGSPCGFQARNPRGGVPNFGEALNEVERLAAFLREMSGAPPPQPEPHAGPSSAPDAATPPPPGDIEQLLSFVRNQPQFFHGMEQFLAFLRRNVEEGGGATTAPPTGAEAPPFLGFMENMFRSMSRGAGDKETAAPPASQEDFKLSVDMADFKPEEIEVKVVDGTIVVSGSHEERADGDEGTVERRFSRKFPVPEGVHVELLTSRLAPGGRLVITAPFKAKKEDSGVEIPVQKKEDEE